MKKLPIILCILCLLCGCAKVDVPPQAGTPDNTPESSQTDTQPNTDPAPVDPVVPDPAPVDPVDPEPTPVEPEPVVPEPIAPVYPDITGFDLSKLSIVYSVREFELIAQDGSLIPIGGGRSFLTAGDIEAYSVIVLEDGVYLAPADALGSNKPQAALELESQHGGSCYPGGDKVVVIDPGHQNKGMSEKEPNGPGSDILKAKVASGTQGVATGIEEYKLNLAVSLLLRDELIKRGYTVVMIREDNDARISNAERAVMANEYGADAFIRVHANGSDNKNTRGAIAIFQTKSNPWCGDLYEQSRLLSETVLEYYCIESGIENDGNWETDTMTGINWTRVPSTIIELGYMSNADEDRLMATSEFHAAAAVGIAEGVDRYFEVIKD